MLIYLDNNNVIELQTLTNGITGVADTGATVTVTINDSTGTAVTGDTWPKAMSHNTGGTYQATLSANLVLTNNRKYTAVVDAVGSGGEVGHWELCLTARVRTS